ncbi:MAG TPA: GGDEF domain-containing protein [Candidatus Acidoferrales bacterium]|nr:GGDEF domain-containing protein [Candidatus Acidoferrales bacterium]
MPSSGAPAPPRLPVEDSFLDLLADTLENLDLPARGQFLQRYFRAITHLELRESQCLQLWDETLVRRRDLAEHLGRPVSLKTALMDVLSSAGMFRVPIIIEYDELKRLQLSAVTDPLTSLYNRRLFTEAFEKELNRARRYSLPFGLVILDLHRFKEVNDRYGHPRGDEVLLAAAATLRKALRTSDSAFRIGGDEFAVLLPQTDPAQTTALSRRIGHVFAETLLPLQLAITVIMDHGHANFPQDGDRADELIRVADERLYHLKHANHARSADELSGAAEPRKSHVPLSPATAPSISPQPVSIDSARPAEPTPQPAPESEKQRLNAESKEPAPKGNEQQHAQPQTPSGAAASATASGISASASESGPHIYATPRKAERVSMAGTNAYAVIGEQGSRRARVLDLGFGGVALELENSEELPNNILAVLHVPILPPVRVNLRPVWSQKTSQGAYRVGCAFVS